MHRRALQLVNHLERRRVNQVEHRLVNRQLYANNQMHRPVNHLLYGSSQTHQRVQTVSQLEFLSLHVSQTEHPVIVVVIVEVVPEEVVVLAGVVLEEAVVEDGNNSLYVLRTSRNAVEWVKLRCNFILGKKTYYQGLFES